MEKTTKSFMLGMLCGTLAGAIGGVLLAPKSGKETRQDIARYTSEMKDKIAAELSKMGEFSRESYNSVVDRVVETYERAKRIGRSDAAEIRAIMDDNFEKIEDVVKKARRKRRDEE